MKLVSAVITTHNRLELLKRAVKSVQDQTYSNIELIVVDDVSTDGTREYCEAQDFTYIYIPKDESRGGNHARNIGIEAAHGEYVAFLDDDDYWLPEKIKKQMAVMESHDCELVHCGKTEEIITSKGISYREKLPEPDHYGDMSRNILLTIRAATTSNLLVKRQALLEVEMFDENMKFWQEYELLIRLAQRKPFYCVHESLTMYRVDVTDNARLTNKYFEWKKAVAYIHEKHRNLYEALDRTDRFAVKVQVYKDAAKRCQTSGLHVRFLALGTSYVLGNTVLKVTKILNGGGEELSKDRRETVFSIQPAGLSYAASYYRRACA